MNFISLNITDMKNFISLRHVIAVSHIRINSDGIDWNLSFKLIYQTMVVDISQRIPLKEHRNINQDMLWQFKISAVRDKILRHIRWMNWFPTSLNVDGLFINCYIPQHSKNGY